MSNIKKTFKQLLVVVTLAQPLVLHAQGPTPDDLNRMQVFLSLMQDYFHIIGSAHEVASDPEKSAILQMQKIQEIYEERGEKARAVEIFEDTLNKTSNPTIRNAAYMLMSDTLKETGRSDRAITLLKKGLSENLGNAK